MKNKLAIKDRITVALDKFCMDVRERRIEQPTHEELTHALISLFPNEKLIPEGSLVVISKNQKSWAIEEPHSVEEKQHTNKTIWLKRRLSAYM